MGEAAPATDSPAAIPVQHEFEFHGVGGEYFRIWIVNIVLTVLTLGIYSAWAKVRTSRYFYGNTVLAGHPFDYHASPVRILIGRLIAVGLLLGYSITVQVQPFLGGLWGIVMLLALPWLVASSLRFAARNTSYRNVRFNFVGGVGQAAWAYIAWPFFALLSLGTIYPLTRRAQDYFYVNNHTFGGKPFHTQFSAASIYFVYFMGLGTLMTGIAAIATFLFVGFSLMGGLGPLLSGGLQYGIYQFSFTQILLLALPIYIGTMVLFTVVPQVVAAMVFNLAVSNTKLDGRHQLKSDLPPFGMAAVVLNNLFFTLITLGLYYPWAKVLLAQYRLMHMKLIATTGLDEFTSEAIATQGAIGEEIAGFFDIGIGL
jgi:uncharacterized membrane protein YjgN (DUF898 family)